MSEEDKAPSYFEQVKLHQANVEMRAKRSDTPWFLYTDGSGQVDVPGASAHVVFNRHTGTFDHGVSTSSRTSVERAELQALLNGLVFIAENSKVLDSRRAIEEGHEKRPEIIWVGDRENLILSVLRGYDGLTLNRRRNNLDMWAALSYWEQYFDILPLQRPRNVVGAQGVADMLCGAARKSLKQFLDDIHPEIVNRLTPPQAQPSDKPSQFE